METASEVKEIRKPLVKQEKQESIINQYIVKFLVFMGLVLALFYLVVTLFKKGVLNKGKLSFLNPGQMVSVINNTYLGPKRSLILVKVHNQVFLLGNSEAGINLISEVKDTMGILKKTELDTTGSNFDYNLEKKQDRDDLERRVKLKERQDLTELLERDSEDTVQLSKRASESKEKVKFSEQIKNKVKNLKPLQ